MQPFSLECLDNFPKPTIIVCHPNNIERLRRMLLNAPVPFQVLPNNFVSEIGLTGRWIGPDGNSYPANAIRWRRFVTLESTDEWAIRLGLIRPEIGRVAYALTGSKSEWPYTNGLETDNSTISGRPVGWRLNANPRDSA